MISRCIGQGGMATVYEACHVDLGARAAVKLLNEEMSQNVELATRFLNEGRAVNRVGHPGLVRIFEFGRLPDGRVYTIMEFLEGETLGSRLRLRPGPSPLPEVLRLGRQLAATLAATHDKGVIHRDLKPDNIMLVPDPEASTDRARILDFGIAKLQPQKQSLTSPDAIPLTQHGSLMGTPAYMAPEQCRGAAHVDASADVYSLGVILYQMLAGRLPFTGGNAMELMAQQILHEPPPLDALTSAPAPLLRLVHEMLRKDRAARPTMAQVAATLERLGSPAASSLPTGAEPPPPPVPPSPTLSRPRQRRAALLLATAVVLGGLGVLALLWPAAPPPLPRPPAPALTLPDLATPPDLRPPPDLAAPPDLVTPPDLARARGHRRSHTPPPAPKPTPDRPLENHDIQIVPD